MVLQLYGLASLMVLALALGPFLRDPANPKASWRAWLFLAVAMALSPVTLPNMVVRRWQRRRPSLTSYQGAKANLNQPS